MPRQDGESPAGYGTAKQRGPHRGAAAIGMAVGAVLNKHKMAKHLDIAITDTSFTFARETADTDAIRPPVPT